MPWKPPNMKDQTKRRLPKVLGCPADVWEHETPPNCINCPFAVDGVPIRRPVRPELPKTRPIGVLVGEGPGNDEHALGQPFVGMTGDELNLQLAENELARSKLLVVNAMGCMPPQGQRTEVNMRAAATACRPWMLSIIRPKVALGTPTLAMGKWAGFLVTGKARAIKPRRGFLRHENKRFTPLILTWHPTYALFRNPWEEANFQCDMDRFARAIRGQLVPLPRAVIKPSLSQIRALWREPFITVDIETGARRSDKPWTGKDPTQAKIKVIGLGTPKVGYAMWWDDQGDDIKAEVRALLRHKKLLKVFQNGYWFDLRVLRRHGFFIRNIMDTRDMRRALSTTSALSLAYMGSVYLDVPDWKAKADDGKE